MALAVTAKAGQTGTTPQADRQLRGLRRGASATSRTRPTCSANPQTYDTIKTTVEAHFIGAVWAETLWEVYWNLVDQYGFDSNLYARLHARREQPRPAARDGRDEAPAVQPGLRRRAGTRFCWPTRTCTGGANQCLIWRASPSAASARTPTREAQTARATGRRTSPSQPRPADREQRPIRPVSRAR